MKSPQQAASIIFRSWKSGEALSALPQDINPQTPEDGYAIQESLAGLHAEP